LKSIEILSEGTIPKIPTINDSLVGTNHPETGVPYESKIVTNIEGKHVEGIFPNFSEHIKFETTLPDELLTETDSTQSEYCNDKLKEALGSGDLNENVFSERQLEQIRNGDKPEGFTWHHSEDIGKMQLVPTDIHSATRHTGGKAIWGGGSNAR